MKHKLLICLLLSVSVIAYSYTKNHGLKVLQSYLKDIEAVISTENKVRPAYSYPEVTMCKATISSAALETPMLWSDDNTWLSFGSTKPIANQAVTIPAGVHIILDEATPIFASLSIEGKLEFADEDINLTAGWIMVMGSLEIGKATAPYTKKAIITLNATNESENVMGMGTRGIMVMGGKLELHGIPPTKISTKLDEHANKNSTTISLTDQVSWNINDQIVVAPSDYYGAGGGTAQRTQITSINGGNTLNIQDGLNAYRWGKLQYLTTTGMSLTPGTLPSNLTPGTPTVLDERPEVANLTRNIVVQSVDDALWQNNGFGCHIMIMRHNGVIGEAHLNSVEIKRGGQRGKLGRYPFHWHMLSYQGSTTLPDATGQYIRNSVINQSAHRGIVIHGTNGTEVSNNVVFDVRGHGIFTEDASERRNVIHGNLVLRIRKPQNGFALKNHEANDPFGTASGYWISNPDNVLTNNIAVDCEGHGFWLAFPEETFGLSADVPLNPSLMKFGVFKANHTHSNQLTGIFLDGVEFNEAGDTKPHKYESTSDMQKPQWPYPNREFYKLEDYTTWKNNQNGIWNRSAGALNSSVTSADNASKFFSGAGETEKPGAVSKSLLVGVSLNTNTNGIILPDHWSDNTPSGFATYHSTFDLKENAIVNFQAAQDKTSGAFALDDYYLIPVDKGTVRNPNNILINSHPGVRTKPPQTQHVYGIIWDPHDYWGGPSNQDNYIAFNTPFWTYGQTPTIVSPNPDVSGGVVLEGPFYGFDNYYINRNQVVYDKIEVIRSDVNGTPVGNWVVEAGQSGDILGNMRHFATHPSGYYYLDFPTISNVNDFNITVTNMLTDNDYQVLSVEYSGDYQITNLFSSRSHNVMNFGNSVTFPVGQSDTRPYTPVNSFQAVVSAPLGEVFWHDRVNNKVWFKVRGGLGQGDTNQPDTHDRNLYKAFKVRAYGVYSPLVLSIKFLSFEAVKQADDKVKLLWNFETDQENVNFEIEKATIGGFFESVMKLYNKKTVKGQNQFSFIDSNPVLGNNYYRIKAIDKDGKINYTEVKQLNFTTLTNAGLTIYPNPTSSTLNIRFNSLNMSRVNAKIINSLGVMVRSISINAEIGDNNIPLNVSELPIGIYYINIEVNGRIQSNKFIKN